MGKNAHFNDLRRKYGSRNMHRILYLIGIWPKFDGNLIENQSHFE